MKVVGYQRLMIAPLALTMVPGHHCPQTAPLPRLDSLFTTFVQRLPMLSLVQWLKGQ